VTSLQALGVAATLDQAEAALRSAWTDVFGG